MHRIVEIPIIGLSINAYLFCLLSAFAVGTLWAGWRAKGRGLNADYVPDMAFWVFFMALVGARLFMFVYKLQRVGWDSLFDLKKLAPVVWSGGMVANGGVLFGLLTFLIYARIKKIDMVSYMNAFAPCFALGVGLVRIGCFLSGCCWGRPSQSVIAVLFPSGTPAGIFQAKTGCGAVLPTQLFESANGFAIVGILLFVEKKLKRGHILFFLAIALYSASRFLVDFARYYERKDYIWGLTNNQWICIAFFVLGIVLLGRTYKPGKDRQCLHSL